MCLCRKVDHRIAALNRLSHGRRVRNIPVDPAIPRITLQVTKVLPAAGIRQLVERGHAPVGVPRQGVADEVAANEPGAAGHEDINHLCASSRRAGCRAAPAGIRQARHAE